jgi:hypothetical protein
MKITVLGKGNAGVLTALHYSRYTRYLNNPVEVELIHDNEISPVPVGQATNLTVPILMWDTIGTSFTNLKDFSFTEKTGIMFENWGKKNKDIPLKDKISLGYNFNSKITSVKKAKENFKELLGVEEIHNHFPYKQYLAKEPIIDNRIILNGNRLFFLEPLEATAVCSYVKWNQTIWEWIINKRQSPEQAKQWLVDYMLKIQSFILYHYKDGSIYNTKFWKESKKLYEKNKEPKLESIVKYVKNKDYDYIRNIHDFKDHFEPYAQWQPWNIKLWVDNI